jgi:SAM-dependent methyltransferase
LRALPSGAEFLVASAFDRHAADYQAAIASAIAFAGQPHERYVEAKVRRLLELARRRLGHERVDALDVGCGTGLADSRLVSHVRSLAGVDVSQPMIARARETNPGIDYRISDGSRLPYGDDSFDLVFAICVFHHVDLREQPLLLREMRRVSRPGGLVVVFEHNPWNPLTRRVVHNISFDEGVELLARGRLVSSLREAGIDVTDSEFLLFSPWRAFDVLEPALKWLPLGAQYAVAGRA